MVKFNYTRIEVDEIARNNHFIRNNVEKVMRLSQILKDFNSIPELKGQMSLKGGTAINGVVFDMPRLSVDLDFDYNHNVSKNEMIEKHLNKKEQSQKQGQISVSDNDKSKIDQPAVTASGTTQ